MKTKQIQSKIHMENENDESIVFNVKVDLIEMQGNNKGKYFVKVATEKKMIWYAEFPNHDEAKMSYDRILYSYGYAKG